jgi:hypothetical protein
MRLIRGRPGGRRPWRHLLIRARSPRCFQRGSRRLDSCSAQQLFEMSLASLRQRDTISDSVARHLGYHVASVRMLFAYGIVVLERLKLECLKYRGYFLQFFPALARSTGIKFPPGCFVLQRQSCACRHGSARQDHLCLGQVRRSDVLFGANARQARRGGDRP